MEKLTKTVHFVKIKGKNYVIIGLVGNITDKSEKFRVSNVKEARTVARKRNATPWNFTL